MASISTDDPPSLVPEVTDMKRRLFLCSKKSCPSKRVRPELFAPKRGAKNMKVFQDACNILKNTNDTFVSELELLDATKVIENLRCKLCSRCRNMTRKSQSRPTSKIHICKEYVKELKHRHLGQPCESGCGLIFTEANLSILEFDHLDPDTKTCEVCRYSYWTWPANGGIAGMEEEYAKCRAICKGCHRISSAAQSAANAAARLLQILKNGGYATEKKEYDAKKKEIQGRKNSFCEPKKDGH